MTKSVTSRRVGWSLVGLIASLIMAQAIADSAWVYIGLLSIPFWVYLSLNRPFIFPFGLYALLIPFDSILSVSGSAQGTTATKILGILSILTLLVKGSFENKLKKPNAAAVWWVVLVLYVFLTVSWAIDPALATTRVFSVIGLLTLYLAAVSYRFQRHEYETIQYFILAGGLLAGMMTIYNYVTGNVYQDISVRTSLIIGDREADPNLLAFDLLIPFSICALFMQTHASRLRKVLYAVVLTTLLFSIILTGSRGGLLGACAIVIVYVVLTRKRMTFVGFLVAAAMVALYFLPTLYIDRVASSVETHGSGRTVIWETGISSLERYGLFGAGLDNFPRAFSEFVGYDTYREVGQDRAPHNILLGNFVEFGIIGLSLTIIVFMKHYQALRFRVGRSFAAGIADRVNGGQVMLTAAFWGVLVASMFLDTFWQKSFWLLWTMILINRNLLARGQWI
ncbi:MAG: O-antigen ligase family protein [Nitrospiraceae bacterium]|nr:O-antigen ligase family protein [Nitrospiraceae bacterium]